MQVELSLLNVISIMILSANLGAWLVLVFVVRPLSARHEREWDEAEAALSRLERRAEQIISLRRDAPSRVESWSDPRN